MYKEIWVEAAERLEHELKREPSEDEVIDYIAARQDELFQHLADQKALDL